MTIQTGESLISFLKTKAEEKGKFFFASKDDLKNADGLITFYEKKYDLDVLERAIVEYLSKEKEMAITLGTFVQQMGQITRAIMDEKAGQEEFIRLVKETKKRMEELG